MSATTADPVLVNNTASAETTVDPAADLSLTSTDSPDPVLAGELVVYTLTAQNAGPDDATGVELTDTLPAGVTFDSATPSQGTCSESSGTVTCALGTIADGPTRASRSGRAPRPRARSRTRRRSPPAFGDPDSADNSASAETTVDPAADLSLTKSGLARPGARRRAARPTALSGAQRRPDDATGVELTDTLPAGVTFDSASPPRAAAPSRAARSPARSARSPIRPTPPSRSKSLPAPAARSRTRQRCPPRPPTRSWSTTARANRPPSTRRRPVADQHRLTRPGPRRAAPDLHPHGSQRGPAGRGRSRS